MKMHFPRLISSLSTRGIAKIINRRLPQYPGNSRSSKMSTKQLSRCNNQETVRERTSQCHSSFSTSDRNDVHGQQTPFSHGQRKTNKVVAHICVCRERHTCCSRRMSESTANEDNHFSRRNEKALWAHALDMFPCRPTRPYNRMEQTVINQRREQS